MLDGLNAFWRGLVGNTQKQIYLPVSGRQFALNPQAYRDPTFISCIEILSRQLSNVRYRIYGNDESEIKFHNFVKVFSVKANNWQNTSEFLRLMERNRLLHGNAYAYIKWGQAGNLDSLLPLDPNNMKVYINDSIEILEADIIYEYTDGKNMYTFLPDEIIHVKAYSEDGIKGRPASVVLCQLLERAGLANDYLTEIMNNGYGGVMTLEYTSDLSKERVKELMAQTKEVLKHQGNRMLALPPGIKASLLGPSSIDSAFLDLTDDVGKKTSAFFGIPLFLLNSDSATGTAGMTSAQASAYYNQVLAPIVNQYAAEFSSKLLTNRQIMAGCHFDSADIAGFSVLDANERVDNLVKLCAGGILTGNEVRKELGFEPYKDELDSGNKIYRNGAFTSGDIGDSTGSKEEKVTVDHSVKT